MTFQFTVDVEVERTQGKFASKDEIEEALEEALGESNPESLSGLGADGSSEYDIISWDVNIVRPKKAK